MTWEGSPWLNCSHWWDGGGWFLKCYKVKPLRGLAGLCNLQHVAATSVDETDGCTWWCKHQSDPPGPVQHMKFPFWPQQVACGTNPTTTTTTLVHKAATQFTNGYKVWFQTLLSHWVTMHNNNEQQMGSSMPTNSLIRLDPGQMRTHAIILSWWIRCGTLMVLWFCVVVGHGTLPLGPWPILILLIRTKARMPPFIGVLQLGQFSVVITRLFWPGHWHGNHPPFGNEGVASWCVKSQGTLSSERLACISAMTRFEN